MIAKHLEGFFNFLLGLAGVPSQFPGEAAGQALSSSDDDSGAPEVRVKNFLHYL